MAKARALDRRRKSIRNIRKITRTMELVSTAQFKRAMDRALATAAYTKRIVALVADLAQTGLEVSHPLLEMHKTKDQAVVLALTANRGMCGGYNSGVLRLATARYKELSSEFVSAKIDISGKRGISALRFRRMPINEAYTHFEHKPTFDEVEVLANKFLEDYQTGKLDRLDVVYTKFISLSKQYPIVETLLPLTEIAPDAENSAQNANAKEEKKSDSKSGKSVDSQSNAQYEFLPSPESILEEVVPNAFKVKLFKCFLDAAVSEQIARMVAMKAATENADQMISSLTTTFNRARQSQITNEIIEVISGTEALEN